MAPILDELTVPARHKLDVGAYYRMAEAGILGPRDHVELIDGEIIDMVPSGSLHWGKTIRLTRHFARVVADGHALVGVQGPLRLDSFNEPEPDLLLLRPRADDYEGRHPSPADVLLVIEVADSSLVYDRSVKVPLYARFGIPELWIVDIANKAVEVFGEPHEGAFAAQERRTSGVLTPRLVPAVSIDVEALLS
jgi:Uma2 family endonuclease